MVIGSINVDLVTTVERFARPGETVLGTTFQKHLGGKGANQAAAAARLGARVALVGCVGEDAGGREALQNLERADVDCGRVRVLPGEPTGIAIITVNGLGDNTIVVVPGANGKVAPSQVQALQPELGDFGAVVLQFEIPDVAVSTAVQAVRTSAAGKAATASTRARAMSGPAGAGLTRVSASRSSRPLLVLNPSPFRRSALPPAGVVDLLIVNETEAGEMSGVAVHDLRAAAEAARRLFAWVSDAGRVVITLGTQGALAVEAIGAARGPGAAGKDEGGREAGAPVGEAHLPRPASAIHVPAVKVQAVDATGAGDVFVGAITTELVAGRSLDEAMRLATAASAVCVTRAGAQPSFPTRAEALEMLKRVNPARLLSL